MAEASSTETDEDNKSMTAAEAEAQAAVAELRKISDKIDDSTWLLNRRKRQLEEEMKQVDDRLARNEKANDATWKEVSERSREMCSPPRHGFRFMCGACLRNIAQVSAPEICPFCQVELVEPKKIKLM